jgi:hypothetical protein
MCTSSYLCILINCSTAAIHANSDAVFFEQLGVFVGGPLHIKIRVMHLAGFQSMFSDRHLQARDG